MGPGPVGKGGCMRRVGPGPRRKGWVHDEGRAWSGGCTMSMGPGPRRKEWGMFTQ